MKFMAVQPENLAVWQSSSATAKISYSHIYVWRSRTEPPILLQWPFGTQPPNLIPANISGYKAGI